MKKVVVSIILILFSLTILCISLKKSFKTDNIDNNTKEFKELIQYQTNSIENEEKISEILRRLEFADYNIETKKEFNADGETLVIYYDCSDEVKILDYYRNFHSMSLIEKNSIVLFALINNLNEVKYVFQISDIELANRHHLSTLPTEYIYTREIIEKHYNQDVREYVNKPNDFMKYNINLNVKDITIYYRENDKIKTIDLKQEEINTVLESIETNNFDVPDFGINTISKIWVDLNNGYIIGIYGSDCNRYGDIIKGNGKEIFASENANAYIMSNSVHKLLPEGLTEYIEEIIENNK